MVYLKEIYKVLFIIPRRRIQKMSAPFWVYRTIIKRSHVYGHLKRHNIKHLNICKNLFNTWVARLIIYYLIWWHDYNHFIGEKIYTFFFIFTKLEIFYFYEIFMKKELRDVNYVYPFGFACMKFLVSRYICICIFI